VCSLDVLMESARRCLHTLPTGSPTIRVDGEDLFPVPEGAGYALGCRMYAPDWREEIVELVTEGNTVAGRFRCSGTHLGEFLGEAPTGKRMDVEEVFFLRVEEGKFVDFWGLEDSLNRMRQLGLLPSRSNRR
jgi:hypothetical protein